MAMLVNILEKQKDIPLNWPGTTLCIDAVDLTKVKGGNRGAFKKLETGGYFVCLIDPERINEMKCPYDIANRKIGVFDICDYHLVQAIANGYRLPSVPTVDYIPKDKWSKIEELLRTEYDVMYAYIVPNSDFQKIIYSQRVHIGGFGMIDISRINAFFPYITVKKTYMDDLYASNSNNRPNAIYNRNTPLNLLWADQYLFTIGTPKNQNGTFSNREPFISRITISPEIVDPAYRCYGELTNENRALCNSSYNAWGDPKKNQTYWDTPCIENKECPFYKANKNYPNEFGKCMSNGICEFPVGIRRLAYVKYTDTFPYTPLCYGCTSDVTDCCTDQKEHPEKYPNLASPDYVFADDIKLREPRNLQTIIPMY